jgi:hypothetical protein
VENIKRLIAAGSTISGAIKEVLSQKGLSVSAFAKKYERNSNNMINAIAGTRAPSPGDLEALIAELGGTDLEWRELLHEAGRPAARAS